MSHDATLPPKITFRPGTLAGPMAERIAATGETPSEYLRRLVARDCRRKPPKMKRGNPTFGKKS